MAIRLPALVVSVCLLLSAASAALAQTELSRQERALLGALVDAVDRAAGQPPTASVGFMSHVLRASDGSHYVAFSLTPPPDTIGRSTKQLLYIRLAVAAVPGDTTTAPRSAVRDWLNGARIDPRLLPQRRGVAIGDMPAMGAGAIGARGAASVGSADLQAMDLERQRARQRREEEEKRRRAELEGADTSPLSRFPFEDFEIGPLSALDDGRLAIQRALTAGPGNYDLFVAWTDAAARADRATPHVVRRQLLLGPAVYGELSVSPLIIAERIGVRESAYSAVEQRAHPYSIGLTEIVPARDNIFTPEERLSVAFQIINPQPAPSGKPNVRVELRLFRMTGMRQDAAATLSPLIYDESTQPPDFDIRLGHPLIAALSVPLSTLARGEYRLQATAEDRLAGVFAANDARFRVVATPRSLLGEAPPLGRAFDRTAALSHAAVGAVVDRLTPAAPSPAMSEALAAARGGRFTELFVETPVPEAERGSRTALTALALLSIGDLGAIAQLERALAFGGQRAPIQYLLGSARATQGRDAEALAAWTAARDAGFPVAVVRPLVAEALLRRREGRSAAEALPSVPEDAAADLVRTFAATRIAADKPDEAVRVLEVLIAREPDDLAARWLLVHALYAEFVGGRRGRQARLVEEAERYISAGGPHAALANEWLSVARQSP